MKGALLLAKQMHGPVGVKDATKTIAIHNPSVM